MTPKPKAQRMPWKEAVQTYGEAALKTRPDGGKYSHQRVSNWRRDGVPGSILIHLARVKHNQDLAAGQTSRLVDAARTLVSVPPPVMAIIAQVQNVWEYSNHGSGVGWRALEAMIASLNATDGKKQLTH